MDKISLNKISINSKIQLLKELGYDSDGEFVINKNGKKILDRYIDIPVRINNMTLFPGSTIILDNNELSVSQYIEEFGDVF